VVPVLELPEGRSVLSCGDITPCTTGWCFADGKPSIVGEAFRVPGPPSMPWSGTVLGAVPSASSSEIWLILAKRDITIDDEGEGGLCSERTVLFKAEVGDALRAFAFSLVFGMASRLTDHPDEIYERIVDAVRGNGEKFPPSSQWVRGVVSDYERAKLLQVWGAASAACAPTPMDAARQTWRRARMAYGDFDPQVTMLLCDVAEQWLEVHIGNPVKQMMRDSRF